MKPLRTPDGHYLVVRGRLWRASNPNLPEEVRAKLVRDLMRARREVKESLRSSDARRLAAARASVDAAKIALGERGPHIRHTTGRDPFDYVRKDLHLVHPKLTRAPESQFAVRIPTATGIDGTYNLRLVAQGHTATGCPFVRVGIRSSLVEA
jgi:hypothetical protein